MREGRKNKRLLLRFLFITLSIGNNFAAADRTSSCEALNNPAICHPQAQVLDSDAMSGYKSSYGKSKDGSKEMKSFDYRYPQVPLEVDNYPVNPEGLKLEQVHVYIRHGT